MAVTARRKFKRADPMITRTHTNERSTSTAEYSDCEKYRYTLTRVWDPEGKKILFLMLNPSTATELQNDPTVERCEQRARKLGFGAFRVCNIFAFRATDPKVMREAEEPIGPENDAAIATACEWADEIVCAWGTHGAFMERGTEVEKMLRDMGVTAKHLGMSKHGHPKHPLYIGYAKHPESWW